MDTHINSLEMLKKKVSHLVRPYSATKSTIAKNATSKSIALLT